MTRGDLFWLAGAMWLGLGIADDNLLLKLAGCGAFALAARQFGRERDHDADR